MTGEPFSAYLGKVLKTIIGLSNAKNYRLAYTNIICCVPYTELKKIKPPSKIEINACNQRLIDYIELVQPKLIISVGKEAYKHIPKTLPIVKINNLTFIYKSNNHTYKYNLAETISIINNGISQHVEKNKDTLGIRKLIENL